MPHRHSDPGQAASDELAVRSVIVRLAQYADGLGTVDQYVDLFTEDAQWLMPGAPRHGRDDIRAGSIERRASGGVGPGSNSRHIVTSTAMNFTSPDEAIADSYFVYVVETNVAARVQLVGHYRDTVVRTGAGWKMARREVSFG
jgi:3-phenylpropionate/cinnamic acid dioxygenase small subunit